MLSASEFLVQTRQGNISIVSVIEKLYQRIERLNSELNIYSSIVSLEKALKQAKVLDGKIAIGEPVGKLARFTGFHQS